MIKWSRSKFDFLFWGVVAALLYTSLLPALGEEVSASPSQYTLARLNRLARENNPTLKQAHQLVIAEEAKAEQAGLWPNPELAYVGEQIGLNNTSGEFQGGRLRQRIVTGGKLSLSQKKYQARADAARDNLNAQELRVSNDIETHFYEVLGTARKIALYQDLLGAAKDCYQTTLESVNIGKMTQAELRLAGVSLQKSRLDLFMAENELKNRQALLESVVGTSLGEGWRLEGNLTTSLDTPLPDWEILLKRTLEKSPRVLAAIDKLRADEFTVEREQAEPFPDLILEAGVGRNNVDQQTVYSAGISLEIPLFDQNQGTIKQAQADLERQRLEIKRLRLELTTAFAKEYSGYLTQYRSALDYRDIILPRSRVAFEMQVDMFEASRIDWPEVLQTQTNFLNHQLAWVDHLVEFQRKRVSLQGFLLRNGLAPPDSPTPPSHIDSVPKPR